MRLKYVITAVGTICSGVTASHLDRYHGLRSSASLTDQQQMMMKKNCMIKKVFRKKGRQLNLLLSVKLALAMISKWLKS